MRFYRLATGTNDPHCIFMGCKIVSDNLVFVCNITLNKTTEKKLQNIKSTTLHTFKVCNVVTAVVCVCVIYQLSYAML